MKNKTDAELVRLINGSPKDSLSAKVELHERHTKINKSTNILTRLIFWLTLFIAVLTCILLIRSFH